jgi:heme exporter protein D
MNLGQHANFIIAAYAIAAVVVVVLIGWVLVDHRRQVTILRNLEIGGVRRRSARQASTSS